MLNSPPPHPNTNWAVYPAILWCASCGTAFCQGWPRVRAHCSLRQSFVSGCWKEESLLQPGDFRHCWAVSESWKRLLWCVFPTWLIELGQPAARWQGGFKGVCAVKLHFFASLIPAAPVLGKTSLSASRMLQPSRFCCICRRLAPAFCTLGMRLTGSLKGHCLIRWLLKSIFM